MAEEKKKIEPGNTIYSFETLENITWHHNWKWFLIFGIILGLLILFSAYFKNWFGLVAFILGGITVFILSGTPPKNIKVEIKEGGIQIDKTFINYESLKSFWITDIDYEGKMVPILYLEPKKKLLPFFKVVLLNVQPAIVEQSLVNFLEKTEPKQDFIEKFIHFLKL